MRVIAYCQLVDSYIYKDCDCCLLKGHFSVGNPSFTFIFKYLAVARSCGQMVGRRGKTRCVIVGKVSVTSNCVQNGGDLISYPQVLQNVAHNKKWACDKATQINQQRKLLNFIISVKKR